MPPDRSSAAARIGSICCCGRLITNGNWVSLTSSASWTEARGVLVARSMSPISSIRSAAARMSFDRAVPVPDLQRPGQRRTGLGVGRQHRVLLEQHERHAVVRQAERRGQADRSGADDGDGQLVVSAHSALLEGVSRAKARSRVSGEPVIAAASDSRNSNGPTTSSGSPIPVVPRQCSRSAPVFAAPELLGVDHPRRDHVHPDPVLAPPRRPASSAKATSAALLDAYAAAPGNPVAAIPEVNTTTDPVPRATMCGTTA